MLSLDKCISIIYEDGYAFISVNMYVRLCNDLLGLFRLPILSLCCRIGVNKKRNDNGSNNTNKNYDKVYSKL